MTKMHCTELVVTRVHMSDLLWLAAEKGEGWEAKKCRILQIKLVQALLQASWSEYKSIHRLETRPPFDWVDGPRPFIKSQPSHTHSTSPIFRLHLCHHWAQCINAPRLPVALVTRIHGHRIGYWSGIAVDPVLVRYIVTVGTYRQKHCYKIKNSNSKWLASICEIALRAGLHLGLQQQPVWRRHELLWFSVGRHTQPLLKRMRRCNDIFLI